MPRYLYECQTCNKKFDVTHSITIKYQVCSDVDDSSSECGGDLVRVPSFSFVIKTYKQRGDKKPGEVTDEFIENAERELKDQKEKLGGQEYK